MLPLYYHSLYVFVKTALISALVFFFFCAVSPDAAIGRGSASGSGDSGHGPMKKRSQLTTTESLDELDMPVSKEKPAKRVKRQEREERQVDMRLFMSR